jgi:flap endonuclease-1
MGVNLSTLVQPTSIQLKDIRGKKAAIDAPNILYQFLSIIRQRDGTPLKDSQGRITSHLAGLLYRTSHLVEHNIKPVYVYDGKPHPLKKKILDKRREVKEKAAIEWQKALKIGDIEEARKKAQQTSRLTSELIGESKHLLDALGIPYVTSLSEGEAQASQMTQDGTVDITASQDFDSLLFGSPFLIRNLTITGKRKLPGKKKWVEIQPEKIILSDVLKTHKITYKQLVEIAILVGTDFNEGIKGIGPVNGLKLIKKYGSLDKIITTEKINQNTLENYEEIMKIFLEPQIIRNISLHWRPIDKEATIRFLCDEHQFSLNRVQSALEKFEGFSHSLSQKKLLDF